MKKCTIALAVAGAFAVPGLASAASSTVQVYGNVRILAISADPDGAANTAGNGRRTRIDNPGGSRIGFKGTEALGGGNTAWFQIESNISGTDGTSGGALGSRNTGVGIRGSWGNIWAGNWDSPYKSNGLQGQPFGATTPWGSVVIMMNGDTTGPATAVSAATAVGTGAVAFERRLNNSIHYQSPSFSGFGFRVAYQANEGKNAVGCTTLGCRDPDIFSGSIFYRNGPIYAGYGYQRHNDFLRVGSDDVGHMLVAKYTTRSFQVGGHYEWLEYEPTTTTSLKRKDWGIFGQYFTGPHRIGLNFIKADDTSGSWTTAVAPAGARLNGLLPAGTDNGAKMWVVNYGYSFSKRTELTLTYAKMSNDSAGQYDMTRTVTNGTNRPGADPSVFGVGLWHTF